MPIWFSILHYIACFLLGFQLGCFISQSARLGFATVWQAYKRHHPLDIALALVCLWYILIYYFYR